VSKVLARREHEALRCTSCLPVAGAWGDVFWKAVIGAMYSQSGKEISWMAFAVLFIFTI
jgi:hypothetical protein